MTILAKRIRNMSESETLAMARKSRELTQEGKDVINLSIGEPDFNTPEFIKDAAKKALDENYTHYTPVAGYPELREAISKKFKRDNNLDYAPSQIVVSTGAKHAIANAMLCVVDKDDEVIVPTPFWVSYKEIIKLAEATPVYVKTTIENDFKVTAKQIQDAITPKTRAIIFSSPCNPSGSVYRKEELKAIAEILGKHKDIYIISDEIYEHINFFGKHESIGQFEEVKDRVITINGVSKGYAMTGWRLGFMGASPEIAKACDKLQGQFTSGTCSISQRAALAALEPDPRTMSEMIEMKAAFKDRRDNFLKLLNEIPGIKTNVPEGAFYLFPDVSAYFGKQNGNKIIKDSVDLSMYLLNDALVALVPGGAFGSPECIRLSYATSMDKLEEAVKRITISLAKLS